MTLFSLNCKGDELDRPQISKTIQSLKILLNPFFLQTQKDKWHLPYVGGSPICQDTYTLYKDEVKLITDFAYYIHEETGPLTLKLHACFLSSYHSVGWFQAHIDFVGELLCRV